MIYLPLALRWYCGLFQVLDRVFWSTSEVESVTCWYSLFIHAIHIGNHENTHLVKILNQVLKPRKYDHHAHFGLIQFSYHIIKNQKYWDELTFEVEGEIMPFRSFQSLSLGQIMTFTIYLSFKLFFTVCNKYLWALWNWFELIRMIRW